MPMTILICGSPSSGFQIIGLFDNSADAQSYAEDYSLKDWWVAEVISPGAFAESQVATASRSHLRLFSAAVATSRAQRRALIRSENRKGPPFSSGAPRPARPLGATLPRPDSGEASGLIAPCEGKCESFRSRLSLRLVGLSTSALHLMSRAQLRELMALFVISSALTVAVFFLALWLLPDKPFTTFLFPRFP